MIFRTLTVLTMPALALNRNSPFLLSISSSLSLSLFLPLILSISLALCLSISLCLFLYLSLSLSFCLSLSHSLFLRFAFSVCLSVTYARNPSPRSHFSSLTRASLSLMHLFDLPDISLDSANSPSELMHNTNPATAEQFWPKHLSRRTAQP